MYVGTLIRPRGTNEVTIRIAHNMKRKLWMHLKILYRKIKPFQDSTRRPKPKVIGFVRIILLNAILQSQGIALPDDAYLLA